MGIFFFSCSFRAMKMTYGVLGAGGENSSGSGYIFILKTGGLVYQGRFARIIGDSYDLANVVGVF